MSRSFTKDDHWDRMWLRLDMADNSDELVDLLEGEDSGRGSTAGRFFADLFTAGQFAPPDPEDWREFAAEFIATMIFVFIGAGSVVVTGTMIGDGITPASLVAIALAHGMTITVLIAAISHISGGHINPAVTFAIWLVGRMDTAKAGMYVIAQLAGAVVGVSPMSGLVAEIVLTVILVFVVFAVAIDPRGPQYLAPIVIGLAVFIDHLFGVTITGASMNPARSFGPALPHGTGNIIGYTGSVPARAPPWRPWVTGSRFLAISKQRKPRK